MSTSLKYNKDPMDMAHVFRRDYGQLNILMLMTESQVATDILKTPHHRKADPGPRDITPPLHPSLSCFRITKAKIPFKPDFGEIESTRQTLSWALTVGDHPITAAFKEL